MSSCIYVAQSNEISLTGAAKRTLVQVTAPTNTRVKVLGYAVFFLGTVATGTPVTVTLERNDTAGTLDTVSGVTSSLAPYDETRQSTVGYAATGEPVAGPRIDSMLVHPQQGVEIRFPPGQEPIIPGGGRLAISCTAPATVAARAKLIFEE